MRHTKEEWEKIGTRILCAARDELFLALPFLAAAFDRFSYMLDEDIATVGTDTKTIFFRPEYITDLFFRDAARLNRVYLHLVIHCLFRHPFGLAGCTDPALWDLCTDIAAEAVLSGMDDPCFHVPQPMEKDACLETLGSELGTLTAEKLYRYYQDHRPDDGEMRRLQALFTVDEHYWWRNRSPEIMPGEPLKPGGWEKLETDWRRVGKRLQAELTARGRDASFGHGFLMRMLDADSRTRTDWRDFLRRFSVLREESRVDPESFDYGLYHYGMEMYGNMPLVEYNEYRTNHKVEELVIAIDTSASCQPVMVKHFLNETAAILHERESFFTKINIHIIECDDMVQKEILITSPDQMHDYTEHFEVRGGYGTDFRPVFSYVERGQQNGDFAALKGLLYFTDGYGIYPTRPTPYDTAFVFWREEDYDDSEVPDWALRLYLTGAGLTEGEQQ